MVSIGMGIMQYHTGCAVMKGTEHMIRWSHEETQKKKFGKAQGQCHVKN